MKKTRKLICLILSITVIMAFSITGYATETTQKNDAYKDYANVFIHGLFGWGPEDKVDSAVSYWGMTSGPMMDYLEDEGYEVAAASVGPISSCWDRCCELYAQLTGTRVDYGEAHVEWAKDDFESEGVNLDHKRFGRDYTGKAIVENWGPRFDEKGNILPECYDNKINLIGHSFGGPTITMFLNLLAEGDASERALAKEKYGADWKAHCSPLFWGDYEGEKLVNSLTSLAGVLNGTTFIDSCDDSTKLLTRLMLGVGNTIGATTLNKYYDFQLEQFGFTKSDNPNYEYTLDLIKTNKFLDAKDNAIYDLSIEGCNVLKQGWECYDNIFYFAYAGCSTTESKVTGNQIPTAKTWAPLVPFATFMGKYTNSQEVVTDINGKEYTRIGRDWLPNDGMVNTITASYVFGCPHKDCDGTVEPGMWITMPSYGFDHMDYGGGLIEVTQNSWQTKAFFDDVMNNILDSYEYMDRLDTPKLSASIVKPVIGVKLSWKAVDRADKYKIYRASSKDGSYSLLKTTTSTSWKDYSGILGKTYYYKIVAEKSDNKYITSKFSNVVSIRVK